LVNTNKIEMFYLKKYLLTSISLYKVFELTKNTYVTFNMHTYVLFTSPH